MKETTVEQWWGTRRPGACIAGCYGEGATTQALSAGSAEAMVIACSEACLDPVLADFAPEVVMVWRSPGNVVPPGPPGERGPLTPALLKGVRDLVVLGHSRCVRVRDWQGGLAPRSGAVPRLVANVCLAQQVKSAAMQNVLRQLDTLRQQPAVAEAVAAGRLTLHGWLRLDETGLFMEYNPARGQFVPTRGV